MATVYELLFLFVLAGAISVTTLKLYNVIHKGEKYTFVTAILLFAGYLLIWLFMLTILLGNPEEILYITTHRLISLGLVLNFVFLIVEMFYAITERTSEMIHPHNSKDQLKYRSRY